jgi:PglZ domain
VSLPPTPALIRAKAGDVLGRLPGARVIALAASPVWTHAERLPLPGDRVAVVRPCVSELAVRDQLTRLRELADGEVLVLLTDAVDLGESVTARLARQRVFPLDRWQQLRTLFRASGIDPALVGASWAVDALLALAPAEGYPPVGAGYLDRDTALAALAASAAGVTEPDLAGLLQWSIDPGHVFRWRELSPEVREGLTAWLSTRGGSSAAVEAVLRCAGGPLGADTVSLGVVLGALTHPEVADQARVPRTILETRALGGALDDAAAAAWGHAAEALVRRIADAGTHDAAPLLRRADELIREVNAVRVSYASPVLECAIGQRIERIGSQVGRLLDTGLTARAELGPLEQGLAGLHRHALGQALAPERVRRAEMAVRLVRWLTSADASADPARSLAEAARRQQDVDAWVDVARARVWEGDLGEIATAYKRLCERVDEVRAAHEHTFALLLADYARAGAVQKEVIGVEDVIGKVIMPLAASNRLLLLVLDGASTGVASELLLDLAGRGWIRHQLGPPRSVVSALPSVTRVSRTSLLCGRLSDGTADTEKAAFAERGWPLFHKTDLAAAGAGEALPRDMQAAIRGKTALVGVVVNTIDDTLDKGGRPPWTAELVQQLLDLLGAAQDAGRAVLLVSDHGHVHERGSRLERDDSGGARWRSSSRPVGPDEVELTGHRVMLGGSRIVVAWNEKLRYGPVRNGYHGGASAQEVVIPLALLARQELDVAGWVPVYHPEPGWWVGEPGAVAGAQEMTPTMIGGRRSAKGKAAGAGQRETPALFEVGPAGGASWIDQLLETDVMRDRLARARRGAMPAEQLAVLLRLLDSRAGTATRAAVARALDIPDARLGSQIAAAQRVVNIDGYDVLEIDGDTVRLNAELLKTQAGLR